MKLLCRCGALIHDQTDFLPHKAHVIPDQDWFEALEAIDAAIEKTGETPAENTAAFMALRRRLGQVARLAWQCRACGRVYVSDQGHSPRELIPGDEAVPRELFRSRPSRDPLA